MSVSARNYWINLFKLWRGDRVLRPLAVVYYVTTQCNLNCVYCEDFGARRNARAEHPLPLDDAMRVLQIVRAGTDSLILTGGEPLLYPNIASLVTTARTDLNFRHITLLTNGLLLPRNEAILSALDRLVISLDTVDPDQWAHIIGSSLPTVHNILDSVRDSARRQRQDNFRLIINCVLTPDTLANAQQVLDFCSEHQLLVSFSPQATRNWPHYDLLASDDYRALLSRLVHQKRRGAPILASKAYLRTMHDMAPFACYPTLIPRVMANGDLVYPCRPIERENGAHGGRPCNLLQVSSWEHALQIARNEYDSPPRMCTSCFQQCFAEPSLMQGKPLSLLRELIRYAPSRRGAVWMHAPG